MKRGFTLVELLIVVVVVGVLAVIALPKYQRSLERGRSAAGLANVRSAAEALNAYYILHDAYPTSTQFSNLNFDLVKTNDFGNPSYTYSSKTLVVVRNPASGWDYQFKAVLSNGNISSITCVGTSACPQLGYEGNLLAH